MKYERKLQRVKRKRISLEGEHREEEGGDTQEEISKKIQKYEKKLMKAKQTLRELENGTTLELNPHSSHVNCDAGTGVTQINKSGMTLLLFYAYVEPIWKPAEHAEVMRWAQSTLQNYGMEFL